VPPESGHWAVLAKTETPAAAGCQNPVAEGRLNPSEQTIYALRSNWAFQRLVYSEEAVIYSLSLGWVLRESFVFEGVEFAFVAV
jgi:hypothetical protein